MITRSSCSFSIIVVLALAGCRNDVDAPSLELGQVTTFANGTSGAELEPLANGSSCSYPLDAVPPDASELRVYFNNQRSGVPNNSRNGWTYSAAVNSVIFHGSSCDAIKSGRVVDIDIVCNRTDRQSSDEAVSVAPVNS